MWINDILFVLILYYAINISLFVVVPIIIDRSISVFLMSEKSNGFTKKELTNIFINQYIKKIKQWKRDLKNNGF